MLLYICDIYFMLMYSMSNQYFILTNLNANFHSRPIINISMALSGFYMVIIVVMVIVVVMVGAMLLMMEMVIVLMESGGYGGNNVSIGDGCVKVGQGLVGEEVQMLNKVNYNDV